MKIVYYSPAYWMNGGAATHSRGLVSGWRDLGHNVLVLPASRQDSRLSVSAMSGAYPRLPQWAMSVGRTLRGSVRARRLAVDCLASLRDFDPDLRVVRRSPYDFVADAISRVGGSELVGEVNAVCSVEAAQHWGQHYDMAERKREMLYLERCHRVACITEEVRAQVMALGVPLAKTRIVPNGVDVSVFSDEAWPHACRTSGPCKIVVAYCASVTPLHDLATAVAAMSELRVGTGDTVRYLFIGPSPDDLRAAGADDAFIACCAHTGPVAHAAVPGLMAQADVGCVALNNSYGSPLKIMEFMAMGIPTAVAAAGTGLDPLRESGGGIVCNPSDVSGLTNALKLLASDVDLREEMGERAVEWVRKFGTWQRMAERMIQDV